MRQLLRQQALGSVSRARSRIGSSVWQWGSPWMPPPRVSARVMPPLACAIVLAVLPAIVHAADPLPASVRACAAITDVLQRLSCYDREVARYPASQAKSAPPGAPAASTSPTPAPQAAAKVVTPPAASSSNTAGASAPPAAAGADTTAPTAGAVAADSSKHFVAHVVSIEHLPNEMILHLDNGQVWQEVQSVSGDLSLREGDAVTIDRHFGSSWLSGPHVSSMKVRQKS
jgi:hypothetical protein